jgi:hypothetical protein
MTENPARALILSDEELGELEKIALLATPPPLEAIGNEIHASDGVVGQTGKLVGATGFGVHFDLETRANAQLFAAVHRLLATARGEKGKLHPTPAPSIDELSRSRIGRELYRSSNGDRWVLFRHRSSGQAAVAHEANQASGGNVTVMDVGTFLRFETGGPEQQALLYLLGELADKSTV